MTGDTLDRKIEKLRALLEEAHGKPLPSASPVLLVQKDEQETGQYYAALTHHMAYGDTPEDAVQSLIDGLTRSLAHGSEEDEEDEGAVSAEPQGSF